jgi:predicted nucleotidyltransferase component of viral defense system
LLDAIRARLDPVLGRPRREKNPENVTLRYRVDSEVPPVVPLRLKVEINSREHFVVLGRTTRPHRVRSPWFDGEAQVQTYTLDELLGTKLRALFQRRKGRDLFDLWVGLGMKEVDPRRVVLAFRAYMKAEGSKVTRTELERNLGEGRLESVRRGPATSPGTHGALRRSRGGSGGLGRDPAAPLTPRRRTPYRFR